MKIAIVTKGGLPIPSVKGGGAETLITAFLNENEKNNNIITVFSISDEEAQKEIYKYNNSRFVYMNYQKRTLFDRLRSRVKKDFPRETPYSFSKVARTIKKGGYDKIIIENSPWQFPFFVKKFGNKVFLHLHNDWINKDLEDSYIKKYRKAINNSGGVIAVSEYIKERVQTIGGINHQKIQVLYNATDIKELKRRLPKEEEILIRKRHKIKDNDIVVLYTGRLCKEKGVLELIEAIEPIIQTNSNVKLLIVGSVSYGRTTVDDYTIEVNKYLDKYPNNIIATGFVDYKEAIKYYDIADLQVIPSMWEEPFGLVAIEGMAKGLPIISTDSGGLKEFIKDSGAIIVDRDNIIENIRKSLEVLIQNPEKREKMSSLALNIMEQNNKFDYSYYYDKYLEILSGEDKKNIYKTKREIKTVEEIQRVALDILVYFHQICENNNLRYSLAYGTLLGAIRHNGFIPWDDDIDVFMPRPDFDKLHKILKKNTGRYKLIKYRSISKIIDTKTILNETGYYGEKNIGVFIDVFPIDGMGNNENKGLHWANRILKNAKRNMYFEDLNEYGIKGKVLKVIGQNNIRKYGKLLSKRYNIDKSKYCAVAMNAILEKIKLKKTKKYDTYIKHQFENREFRIFKEYDELLKELYGDYMKLPPEEDRVSPHEYEAFWKEDM